MFSFTFGLPALELELLVIEHMYIFTGADLASPTCHGTGCFFASSRGYAIKICLESFPISLEASWHWLILASIGALGNVYGLPDFPGVNENCQ